MIRTKWVSVLLYLAVIGGLSGCSDDSDWSTGPPPADKIAQTNNIRRELGIREVQGDWAFYGRQFGVETWKQGQFQAKKVCYDDTFEEATAEGKPPTAYQYSYDYNNILWEQDYYYTGRTFPSTTPDEGKVWEFLSLLYDYRTKRFGLDIITNDNQILAICSSRGLDSGSGQTNEQTLEVADRILQLWGQDRLGRKFSKNTARYSKLINAVKSQKWEVQVRALEELWVIADHNAPAVQHLLIEMLFSEQRETVLDTQSSDKNVQMGGHDGPVPESSETAEQYSPLADLLKGRDLKSKVRVLEELGFVIDLNDPTGTIEQLIRISSSNQSEMYVNAQSTRVARILSRAGPSCTERIIARYETSSKGTGDFERLLRVLGYMGYKANSAVPFLLKQLDETKDAPESLGAIRVVLANVGYESKGNTDMIISEISKGSKQGNAAVTTMAGSGAAWANEQIIKALVDQLLEDKVSEWQYDNSGKSGFAALALASTGSKGEIAQGPLDRLFTQVQKDEDLGTLLMVYGLSLAKVSSSNSDKPLRKVLKYMGSEDFGNHTDWHMLRFARYLITPDIIEQIGEMLKDKNRKVVCGAVRMLGFIGFEGHRYAPSLLNILERNKDEELRESAAEALGYVAEPNFITALRAVLEKEKSEFVREEIAKAIRIIRLEDD
jgi:hypothetical protein